MPVVIDAQPARRVRVGRGIYQQPNGKYAVCFMIDGKPRFRTVGDDFAAARVEREALVEAAKRGEVPVAPCLRFGAVADRWIARYEILVATDQRRERTLEAHRYYLDRHLRPRLARRRASAITANDVSDLIVGMREAGCAEKTTANALATVNSVLHLAARRGWIVVDPVAKLERGERPRPESRVQRVLGRDEVARLLACCADRYRLLVATALFTGMRISELLGLIWEDVEPRRGHDPHARTALARASRRTVDAGGAEDARRGQGDPAGAATPRDAQRASREGWPGGPSFMDFAAAGGWQLLGIATRSVAGARQGGKRQDQHPRRRGAGPPLRFAVACTTRRQPSDRRLAPRCSRR